MQVDFHIFRNIRQEYKYSWRTLRVCWKLLAYFPNMSNTHKFSQAKILILHPTVYRMKWYKKYIILLLLFGKIISSMVVKNRRRRCQDQYRIRENNFCEKNVTISFKICIICLVHTQDIWRNKHLAVKTWPIQQIHTVL